MNLEQVPPGAVAGMPIDVRSTLTTAFERLIVNQLFLESQEKCRAARYRPCQTRCMTATLEWKGGLAFTARVPTEVALAFDSADEGAEPIGPSPMEGLLASLAACTAMDVISILEKKRQHVTAYRVEIEADRIPAGQWPRPFTAFRIKHVVEGDVDPAALQRAITLSEETYCSVSATLRTLPKITNTWEIS